MPPGQPIDGMADTPPDPMTDLYRDLLRGVLVGLQPDLSAALLGVVIALPAEGVLELG